MSVVSLVKPLQLPALQALVRAEQNTATSGPLSLNPVCAAESLTNMSSNSSWVEAPCGQGDELQVPFSTRSYALRHHASNSSCAAYAFGDGAEGYACVDYEDGAYHLSGRTLEFTLDLSGDDCGCNAAIYLVSMPDSPDPSDCGDRYCDANSVCGVRCEEIDLVEANRVAFVSTVHTATDGSGVAFGVAHYVGDGEKRLSSARACSYGPSEECTIDTREPFAASFTFSPPGEPFGYSVTLSQGGRVATAGPVAYGAAAANARLRSALDRGMTLVLSHWAGETRDAMAWLDQPCSAQEVDRWGCTDAWLEQPTPWPWGCAAGVAEPPSCRSFSVSALSIHDPPPPPPGQPPAPPAPPTPDGPPAAPPVAPPLPDTAAAAIGEQTPPPPSHDRPVRESRPTGRTGRTFVALALLALAGMYLAGLLSGLALAARLEGRRARGRAAARTEERVEMLDGPVDVNDEIIE